MRGVFFISVLVTLVVFESCKNTKTNNSDELTTELVKNPITANGKSDMKDMPVIKFEKLEHKFGILLQGEKVSHVFKFKNIGKQDLIIKDASASCGCTVPKFSQKPVKSGEEGEIEVVFDSNRRTGSQLKTITVWTNCVPNQTKLQITAEIVVPN